MKNRVLIRSLLVFCLAVTVYSSPGLAQDSRIFRLLTFATEGNARLGATQGDGVMDIVDVHHAVRYLMQEDPQELGRLSYIPADMKTLIEAGSDSIAQVRRVYETITRLKSSGRFSEPGGDHRVFYPPASVRYLPPVPNPSKVLGLAGAYPREELPEYPSVFFKSVAALIGHEEEINLAGLVTVGVHEPEFALVIGKQAKNVTEAQAFDYIVGYTILNDVSARDLPQGNHTAQGSNMSKGLDTFAPCGPFLTLKEDVPDPHNLTIAARLNGEAWDIPNANTRHLTHKIPQIIAYLTQRMTLLPGDIISTGVPAPVVPLRVGDTAEMIIEHLGTLRNRVVAGTITGGMAR